jgi:peptidyl-prolyl cis-trans isomerase A (cyclophilin A)/peptidyl-prolyl cis-trans isomerase B (cyclophilin B)
MMRLIAAMMLVPAVLLAVEATKPVPRVRVETTKGTIVLELYPDKAPKTVANFLEYVQTGHYIGTIFHRVIPGFMIQGGGVTATFQGKPLRPPVANEAGNGLKNQRGTLAMARTSEVDSATAQIFINLKDNTFLDHKDETPQGFGYCIFGKVVEGMSVVDAIAAVPTGPGGPFAKDVPKEAVMITKATLVEAK